MPSTAEKDDAKRTGEPVLVSVWNEDLTTLERARVLYGDATAIGFRLLVGDIENVATTESGPRLRVLTDPYPEDVGDGALGHCGISGLDRRPEEARPAWRNMLAVLAEHADAC